MKTEEKSYILELPDNYLPPPLPGRNQWLQALRSDKYKQGRGLLRGGMMPQGAHYCCLGVLCELQGRLSANGGDEGSHSSLSFFNPLRPILGSEATLKEAQVCMEGRIYRSLAALNDFGLTFQQIAAIIERVWAEPEPEAGGTPALPAVESGVAA